MDVEIEMDPPIYFMEAVADPEKVGRVMVAENKGGGNQKDPSQNSVSELTLPHATESWI